jgi:hypothetical protein
LALPNADPDHGWVAEAHISVLKSLSNDFEITVLSTTRHESAGAAGKLFDVPNTFDNHHDLVNSPVDVVVVTNFSREGAIERNLNSNGSLNSRGDPNLMALNRGLLKNI